MKRSRSRNSLITLLLGLTLTVAVSTLAYFFPQSDNVTSALLLGLLGVVITLTLDTRIRFSEMLDVVEQIDADANLRSAITRLSRDDEIFELKYNELLHELSELGQGQYRIRTLTSLYIDDIRSIELLRRNEALLSTCPVSHASEDAVMLQLNDPYYIASINAHKAAAARGVYVTRIYLIRDLDLLKHQPLRSHLHELEQAGIEIRVILRDRTILENEFDFLVFGDRKVSVGIAEPGAGTVSGAVAYTNVATIEAYKQEYNKLKLVSRRIEEFLGEVG